MRTNTSAATKRATSRPGRPSQRLQTRKRTTASADDLPLVRWLRRIGDLLEQRKQIDDEIRALMYERRPW